MINITALLQNNIRDLFDNLKELMRECKDIYDAYWKTNTNIEISALSTDSDPATVTTHLTKGEYTAGLTLCQELNDFFQNAAVTSADYTQTAMKCKYGSAADLATQISNSTEQIGTKLYDLCEQLLEDHKTALNIIDDYNDNEVSDSMAVIESDRIVYGSHMTKEDLTGAITLLSQLDNFMSNGVVTQASYSATIAKWDRLEKINL